MSDNKKILVISFQSLTEHSAGGMAKLGYFVSQKLHEAGVLKKFIVYSKGKYTTNFPSEPVSPKSRYYLFLLNRLNKKLHFPAYKFRLIQEKLFDRLCKRHITNDVSLILTTNAHMPHTLRKANAKGIPIIYIPANQEENWINELILNEKKKLGITTTDAYTYPPRIQYYNRAIKYIDTVVGTYNTVYNSYKSVKGNFDTVQVSGHIKPDFKPLKNSEKVQNKTFIVGYLAHTVVIKGLQYLVEGWEQLQKKHPDYDIELQIAGYIQPELKAYIDKRYPALQKVKYLGYLSSVSDFYESIDTFVVPSLSEGGPYTALEAAHYKVPVIITNNCSSSELLGNDGCITITTGDANAICNSISLLYNDGDKAVSIGEEGNKRLEAYSTDSFYTKTAEYLLKRLKTL